MLPDSDSSGLLSARSTASSSHVSDLSICCVVGTGLPLKSQPTLAVWNCLSRSERVSLLQASSDIHQGLLQDIVRAAVSHGVPASDNLSFAF